MTVQDVVTIAGLLAELIAVVTAIVYIFKKLTPHQPIVDMFRFNVELLWGVTKAMIELLTVITKELRIFWRDHRSNADRRRAAMEPPRAGKLLARFIMKPKDQEAALGDLEEIFHIMKREHGTREARAWYYWQVVRSVLPGLWSRLVAWGVVAALVKIIKQMIAR